MRHRRAPDRIADAVSGHIGWPKPKARVAECRTPAAQTAALPTSPSRASGRGDRRSSSQGPVWLRKTIHAQSLSPAARRPQRFRAIDVAIGKRLVHWGRFPSTRSARFVSAACNACNAAAARRQAGLPPTANKGVALVPIDRHLAPPRALPRAHRRSSAQSACERARHRGAAAARAIARSGSSTYRAYPGARPGDERPPSSTARARIENGAVCSATARSVVGQNLAPEQGTT